MNTRPGREQLSQPAENPEEWKNNKNENSSHYILKQLFKGFELHALASLLLEDANNNKDNIWRWWREEMEKKNREKRVGIEF